MSKKPKGASSGTKNIASPYQSLLISAALGLLVGLTLLLLFSLLLSARDIPNSLTMPITTLILILMGIIAGHRCGRLQRHNGMLNGFLVGLIEFAVLLLISLAVPGHEVGILALYKLLILVVSACIGSILGVNKRTRIKADKLAKRS